VTTADTLVWISGATDGIGAGLARTCPHAGATIVNLSRRTAEGLENVRLDLCDPATWDAVTADFERRLADFDGVRALFVHNAFHYVDRSFAGEGDRDRQREEAIANVTAPIVLGDRFLRAAAPAVARGVDVGLVQMSSAAAGGAYPGLAVYAAAKAGVEQWVRVVRAERAARGRGPWVLAVRPGFVDTPAAHRDAVQPVDAYPSAPAVAEALERGDGIVDADTAGRAIWAVLGSGAEGEAVVDFGAPIRPADDG
jgi:NAD(P)-dependent dehydrogenase (short-subunit alcohol dehydrogenase family)